MDETRFTSLAAKLLAHIAEVAEEAGIDNELQGNVLTLELDDGRQFVINGHAPLRQIWLASPISGASHYEAVDEGLAQDRSTPSHPGDPVLNVNPSQKQTDRADSRSQSKPFNGLDFERPALAWRSTRGGSDFFATLSADIEKATGTPVAFD